MSRFLITGATGFIGKRLSRLLCDQGHEVHALARREIPGPWSNFYTCRLGEERVPRQAFTGIEGVFHLANIAHTHLRAEAEHLYWHVNVKGTEDLLRSAISSGVPRFVNFSSVRAVQRSTSRCIDETWIREPVDAYGVSKREAERRVLAIGREAGIHVCNLRPALTYGPGAKGNLERMISSINKGVFPPLPDFGNRLSMVSVDDLAQVAVLAMLIPRANGNTYFISDDELYSPRDIYQAIASALGKSVPRWHVPAIGLKAAAHLGDWARRLFGIELPLNSDILMRMSSWDCYRSERIRHDLGWQSSKTFYQEIAPMVQAQLTQEARDN